MRFRRSINERSWISGALVAITFDSRPVAGPLEVEALFDRIIRAASTNRGFVQRLARSALRDRPPTGFLRNSVVQSKGGTSDALDVKASGITLITGVRVPITTHPLQAFVTEP